MMRACGLMCLIALLCSCQDDQETGRVRGQVSLADVVCPPPPGDLQGTLVLVTSTTPYGNLVDAGMLVQKGVDLSRGPVSFELKTRPGSYHLFAFLDENDTFEVWPAMEIGDAYGISGQAIEVVEGQEAGLSFELTHTHFSSSYPLDFTGICNQEPFGPADRFCLLEFVSDWVNDCYPLLGLRQIDWPSVVEHHRGELDQVQDDNQLYHLLSRLLAELQDAHVWLDPATSVHVLEQIVGGEPGRLTGFSIALVDDLALVLSVEAGSQAEQQGLAPGDQLEQLGGRTVADWLERWRPIIPAPNPQVLNHLLAQALLVHKLADPVAIQGRRPDQTPFSLALQPGELRVEVQELPIGQAPVSTPDGRAVSLVRLGAFAGDEWEFASRYASAMEASLESEALVFDLRDNNGGSIGNLHMVLSILFDQTMELVYYWDHHAAPDPLDVFSLDPLPPVVTHPLVVLVDESCYSTCNLFAQIIQETGRGTILGRPTGGGNTSPAWIQLSESLGFHIPALYLTTASKVDGETDGITPDVQVPITVEDIQAGGYGVRGNPATDTLLGSALHHIDLSM